MSAITWIEGEERSGSVMLNGFSSQYRKHMKCGNEALIMTEPTASEASRPTRGTRCFTGGVCSNDIHQLASSSVPTALLNGPVQHDNARPVASWRVSSTAMVRPYGRLLPILFFALLAVVLIPAASAQAACSVVGQPCVRDDFDSRAYDLNTGTDDWATDWVEIGEADGPALGVTLVPVTLGVLHFQAVSGTDETNYAVSRDVAIPAAASSASLSLRIGYSGGSGLSREFAVEATGSGLPPLFELINGNASPNPATYAFPLIGSVGGKTINVTLTNLANLADTPDYWYIDFVEVTYDSPLAVTLADFNAQQQNDHILVTWETASELDNQGFNLYRSTSDAAPEIQLNNELIPSQAPGSASGYFYTWEDRDSLTPGTTYYYWLEDVSLSGAATLHGPVSATYSGPTAVALSELQAASGAGPGGLAVAAAVLALLLPLLAISTIRQR